MSAPLVAAETVNRWTRDPIAFVKENFNATPERWQADVLRDFVTHQRVAMIACKGPGKTCVEAWCAWLFAATRADSKIACTSISADNLRDNLWTELAFWQKRSPLLKGAFTWGKERIVCNDRPETWWMAARSWSASADTSKQADTLAGLHARSILFILDEAGGIPNAVMASASAALATGGDSHILMGGNPTHLEGPLYLATTTEKNLWRNHHITGDPDAPNRSLRVSVQWARDEIARNGRNNPWVLVNVFGQFPPSSLNVLLGPEDVRLALGRPLKDFEYNFMPKVLGVDVARFGDDRTVILPRQGRATWDPVVMRGARTNEIAARIATICAADHIDGILIDDTGGWAAGVIDALLLSGIPTIPINSSGSPIDSRYFNKRAEMHFLGAEWVKTGGSLVPCDDWQRELTAPTYTFHNGRFQVESKADIKARLGFSPDVADALLLSLAVPVHRGQGIGRFGVTGGMSGNSVEEYVPNGA